MLYFWVFGGPHLAGFGGTLALCLGVAPGNVQRTMWCWRWNQEHLQRKYACWVISPAQVTYILDNNWLFNIHDWRRNIVKSIKVLEVHSVLVCFHLYFVFLVFCEVPGTSCTHTHTHSHCHISKVVIVYNSLVWRTLF